MGKLVFVIFPFLVVVTVLVTVGVVGLLVGFLRVVVLVLVAMTVLVTVMSLFGALGDGLLSGLSGLLGLLGLLLLALFQLVDVDGLGFGLGFLDGRLGFLVFLVFFVFLMLLLLFVLFLMVMLSVVVVMLGLFFSLSVKFSTNSVDGLVRGSLVVGDFSLLAHESVNFRYSLDSIDQIFV